VTIQKLGMPKWGLSMKEGKLLDWLVDEGAKLDQGTPVAEVETEKISGEVEAPAAGVLRRRVAEVGKVYPVGALLGVIAEPDDSDAEIDAFVEEFLASFVPEEAAAEAAGPQPETIEVGGRKLRYLALGDEESAAVPAVLLHGYGGDLNNWLFNQEALAGTGRRVYALDLPGHGGSDKDVGAGDLAALAETLGGFLDAAGVGRAHLVGHSMGGAVASRLALDAPDRVATLTLIAGAGLGEAINREYIEGFLAADRRRAMKQVLQLLFANAELVSRQLVDDVLKYKRLDGVDAALRTLAGQLFPEGRQPVVLASALAAAAVPVLVIWGAQDQVIPPDQANALRDRARVEVLDATGHSPHMERAGEVNRLLPPFWTTHEEDTHG
jgi:pyruvate dehydrogenase E2 component (dihydrolipoamide acetyltransferase)